MENETDFFAYTLSFQKKKKKQENRNRIQKTVFPTLPSKKQLFFYSWIHQKKSTVKKKKQSLQEESKKGELHKNEKPFFKRQKDKTWNK